MNWKVISDLGCGPIWVVGCGVWLMTSVQYSRVGSESGVWWCALASAVSAGLATAFFCRAIDKFTR